MLKVEQLIKPQSIAVIGASSDQSKIGYQILNNLIQGGFKGTLVPINPKGGVILGKEVKQNVSDVNGSVDLAIIVIPAQYVLEALISCGESRVKSVVVISAGFSETGPEGSELESQIAKLCQQYEMALLGPNCLGFINTENKINASFANSFPKEGNIALVSQSGAMITALIDWSDLVPYGFSKIFSLGNKVDINEEEILEYLYQDEQTKVIALYLESLTVGSKLTSLLSKYSKTKPTIVLFGGKTAFGAGAAKSHTGAMISSYTAVKTYLNQAGVILAEGLSDLFTYCRIFSAGYKVSGNNFAVVTNAGGPSIATCDAMFGSGLGLAVFSENTSLTLSKTLSADGNMNNPVDLLGDATSKQYREGLEIVLNDENVDGVFALLTPQSSTDVENISEVISKIRSEKPIIPIFIGGLSVEESRLNLEKESKPCFEYPEEAVMAAVGLVKYNCDKVELFEVAPPVEQYDPSMLYQNLNRFNIPTIQYTISSDFQVIKNAAEQIGYPVVLKIAGDATAHKSESGGIKLNLIDENSLGAAFDSLPKPVMVGKMVKAEQELFVGIKKDPHVGTLIAFGTGGIFSEIYLDISYRVSPISMEIAKKMISETKMGKILDGARNQTKFDLDKLAELLVNAALFADSFKNIAEIDFNPVLATATDYYVVDARIITSE